MLAFSHLKSLFDSSDSATAAAENAPLETVAPQQQSHAERLVQAVDLDFTPELLLLISAIYKNLNNDKGVLSLPAGLELHVFHRFEADAKPYQTLMFSFYGQNHSFDISSRVLAEAARRHYELPANVSIKGGEIFMFIDELVEADALFMGVFSNRLRPLEEPFRKLADLQGVEKFSPKRIAPIKDYRAQYSVEKSLGNGSMGTVCRVKEAATNNSLAIKSIKFKEIWEDAIARELAYLKKVYPDDHINAFFYRSASSLLLLCIVIPYYSGGDLFDYIQSSKQLNADELFKISSGIFSGLQKIHKLGIVHCDIKPDNILLDGNKVPYIVDFGLSHCVGDTLNVTCDLVTAPYRGQTAVKVKKIVPEIDTFALIVLLAELWVRVDSPEKRIDELSVFKDVLCGGEPWRTDFSRPIAQIRRDFLPKVTEQIEELEPFFGGLVSFFQPFVKKGCTIPVLEDLQPRFPVLELGG